VKTPKPNPKTPTLADVTFTDASGQVIERFQPVQLYETGKKRRDGRYVIGDVEAMVRTGTMTCVLYYELGELPDEADIFPTIELARDYLSRTALTSERYRLWSVEKKLDGGAA
jgi:hypothetical protein